MNSNTLFHAAAQELFPALEKLIPHYLEDPVDYAIAEGNLSCLVMDGIGNVSGFHWGDNRVKQRQSAQVAWQKVMQVWLTDTPTGLYEQKVYSRQMNWWEYGIPLPELIGWEGGLPARLADGTPLALAFSGFRGEQDCAILRAAVASLEGRIVLHIMG